MNNEENKDMFDLGSESVDNDFDPFASEDDLPTDNTATEPEAPVNTSEIKDIKAEQDLGEKPPVFEYAGVAENIDETSKTFDELRIEKSSDFPELDDGKRVSWTVEYGKVTKTVAY